MGANASEKVDFSLESRVDYLFLAVLIALAVLACVAIVGLPLYVFYEVGVLLSVTRPILFALGGYIIVAVYFARGAI